MPDLEVLVKRIVDTARSMDQYQFDYADARAIVKEWAEEEKPKVVRPRIEEWLITAVSQQRITVDEFIALVSGFGDSGSLYQTIEACITASSLEYVREVVEIVGAAMKVELE